MTSSGILPKQPQIQISIVAEGFETRRLTEENAEEIANWTGGTLYYAQGASGTRYLSYIGTPHGRITPGQYVVKFNDHTYFGLPGNVVSRIMKETQA